MEEGPRHLSCPVCAGYDVSRLYIASADVDACECLNCDTRWDEYRTSGERRGATAVVMRRVR